MLRIWGRTNSINVMKVLWLAEELGLRYERIEAGMQHGVVDTPEYRAMNPNGRVPTIDDDGFVLWESNTIVRYLAAKHAPELAGNDPRTRADRERWMDWTTATIAVPMSQVFWQLIRTPAAARDSAAIDKGCTALLAGMRTLDARLAGRSYMVGERFSIADVPIGCFAHRWLALPIERPALANIAAWHARLAARPLYRDQVMQPLS